MGVLQLRCQELTKRHGDAFRLGPLSFELSEGVTCLVGPNGAGKSTFLRLAAAMEKPTSGSLALEVHGAGAATGVTAAASRLGYLPQALDLPARASCAEFLSYTAWVQCVPRSRRPQAVRNALEAVGLEERSSQKIKTLSGGMVRRLGIAHALVHDPAVVLLDEPTAGLDPRQRAALRGTVSRVSTERIVLVSTHLVEDVRGLADRVLVLNEGSLVFDGSVAELEKQAAPDAPGDTDLERAISALMGDPE